MRTIFYARVSTKGQTIAHQRTQAEAAGFKIDEVVADDGVSGVSTSLAERPQGRRLFDLLRADDTLLVRWVDRLGRDYHDVSDTIEALMRRGVVVKTVINNMVFDGAATDPMQKAARDAMIRFMAAIAQAQAEAMKEARLAGIAHARASADGKKYKGRKPSYSRDQFKSVQQLLGSGLGVAAVARSTGLTVQTVLRIRADPAASESVLATWGM